MHFTRPRDLLGAGLACLAAGYLLLQVAYGSLPRLPLFVGATLAVLALLEVFLAFSIRGRISGGRVLQAIAVARSVALAKASSLAGSVMLGFWLAAVIYLLPKRGLLIAAASDLRSAVVGAASAAVLIGAGLWLEHCCRTPEPRDRDRAGPPTG
ncbi:Protein of unknown function [Amycolatopsis xylanica]|uniref:DUF3180 domain-containing protein n=1 Tax=Amycolatopsis xylanica TaxID=589385 RepID=A0A1H2Z324_9PSEU|nr:DUF3180 domain-containing protein [Amycolatopsis xylanica]SDX11776.1 Protein of unknown function [Amycolatopsis xylanica]